MIRGIKPRSLEDNPDRRINFPQSVFVALWTTNQGRIVETLLLFKPNPAIFAMICIDRHLSPLFSH